MKYSGNYVKKCFPFICTMLLGGLFLPAYSTYKGNKAIDTTSVNILRDRNKKWEGTKHYRPNYWFISGELMSPMTFGTLSSWTNNGNMHLGYGAQLTGGYQFSSVFALQASFGLGRSRASYNDFQRNFYLGTHDAYTYYPYTMIDGVVYNFPATVDNGRTLIGEQGNNLNVEMTATPFPYLKSKIGFWQTSVNAIFNLTRLFYSYSYREKPVELLVKPGFYLSHYDAKVTDRRTGNTVAPNVNSSLTWGLGGDATLRFNVSQHLALELTNRFIWQHDRKIDGIRSIRHAYDSYVWQPAIGIAYKFRKKAEPTSAYLSPNGETVVPIIAPIPVMALTPALANRLQIALPEKVVLPETKPRNYSAYIALTYPLNKTYIDRNLHSNAEELHRVDTELKQITANPDYTVQSIRVEGFASPEGPLDNNRRLCTGRAQSIIDYLVAQNPQLYREQFRLGRVAENWDGLRDTLQHNPSLPGAQQVLALLNRQPDTERVKSEIKQIAGYDYLLKNVYPYLRKSSYSVQFAVRAYALPEAKEKMKTQPENVGAEEMFAVALNDGLETADGQAALTLLQRIHPDASITKLYRSYTLLKENKNKEALDLLKSFEMNDGYYYNLMGVAQARNGQWDVARQYFKLSDTTESINNLQLLINGR